MPLASVLALISDIEEVTASAETKATLRRARSHALEQERLLGGVRRELGQAVEAIYEGLMNPRPGSAVSDVSRRHGSPSSLSASMPLSAREAAWPAHGVAPQPRRPFTARAASRYPSHRRPGTSPSTATSRGGAQGPSILLENQRAATDKVALLNPLEAIATRRQLKEVAGRNLEEEGLSHGAVLKVTRWQYTAFGDNHNKSILR